MISELCDNLFSVISSTSSIRHGNGRSSEIFTCRKNDDKKIHQLTVIFIFYVLLKYFYVTCAKDTSIDGL